MAVAWLSVACHHDSEMVYVLTLVYTAMGNSQRRPSKRMYYAAYLKLN